MILHEWLQTLTIQQRRELVDDLREAQQMLGEGYDCGQLGARGDRLTRMIELVREECDYVEW